MGEGGASALATTAVPTFAVYAGIDVLRVLTRAWSTFHLHGQIVSPSTEVLQSLMIYRIAYPTYAKR